MNFISKFRIALICVIFAMVFTCIFTSCGDLGNDDEDEGDVLKEITVTVDKTDVDIGDKISVSFETNPKSPITAHNGEKFSYDNIQFYVTINGETTLLKRENRTIEYTVATADDLEFFVKYCDHEKHSDTKGDLLSNVVKVTINRISISTVDELKAIENTNKAYKLANDIDLSGESDWKAIQGFTGKLDGDGHKITNLKINGLNVKDIGFFDILQGTVENLTFENAQITARGDIGNAGIVAGTNQGYISNVTVGGKISPEYYSNVGGLVGYNDCGKIVNSINQAEVTGANKVGGVVGYMSVNANDAITGCVNKGKVSGKDKVGGVAGYITMPSVDSNSLYSISNNTNENAVDGVNQVGGVFGEVYGMFYDGYSDRYGYFEMSVLTNKGTVNGHSTGIEVGGVIGKAIRLNILTTCENLADVSGGDYVGGLVGNASGTSIKAMSENTATITGKGKVGGFAGHAGVIEYASNKGQIISTGILVEDGVGRAYVGGIAGYCEGLIGCENSADIKINANASYVGGLAGYVCVSDNDRVSNNVNNGAVSGADCVGGIAGYLTMPSTDGDKTYKLSNNENKNVIEGTSNVGGIFGEVYGMFYDGYHDRYGYFEMSVLTNNAEVKGSATGKNVGGLVGKATRITVLTTCDNKANVSGGSYVGGFVGLAPDTNIKATGTTNNNIITGTSYIGGFAGKAGIIENAVNSGEVISVAPDADGNSYLGGIAGYCTGIIGCTNNTNIEIINAGNYIGGIAGYVFVTDNDMVNDNVNVGSIAGADKVGGIAGYVVMPEVEKNVVYVISNNKNQNVVMGNDSVGGIFGEVNGMFSDGYHDYYGYFQVINCVNEAEITGIDFVGGIIGAYKYLKTESNFMDTNTTLYGEKLGQ